MTSWQNSSQSDLVSTVGKDKIVPSDSNSSLLAYNSQRTPGWLYGGGLGTANDEAAEYLSFWSEDGLQTPSDSHKKLLELQAAKPAKRHRVLRKLMKDQSQWQAFLAGLRSEDVALIQEWLPAQLGNSGTGGGAEGPQSHSLDEQIDLAYNSERGKDALQRVDQMMSTDKNQPSRITPRLRELLALGVALPKLAAKTLPADADYLAEEGVLGAVQAERAAQALIEMPVQEYARTLALLEQVGSRSSDQQAFLILKALAARQSKFANQDTNDDSLVELEGFAGSIRKMNSSEIIENTSVTQTQKKKLPGIRQHLSASCGIVSSIAIRAEADPIEALAINKNKELDISKINGNVTGEEKEILDRTVDLKNEPKKKALVLDFLNIMSNMIATINELKLKYESDAEMILQLTTISLAIVSGQLDKTRCPKGLQLFYTNSDFNEKTLDLILETRRTQRENPPNPEQGLTSTELRDEMNNGLNINKIIGHDVNVTTPDLDRAAKQLESGQDVMIMVSYNAQDGHAMTFTNVRTVNNGREFLVHDPLSGKTRWIAESDIKQGNWPDVLAQKANLNQLIF